MVPRKKTIYFVFWMKNYNTFGTLNQKIMKKLLLGATFVLGTILCTQAQGYYNLNYLSNPGNPGGVNTDFDYSLTNTFITPAGVTKLIGHTDAPKYSSSQTLPFAFKFNGGPVTNFVASSSGYITFSKATLAAAGNTPQALPSALMPDSSICVWGLCTAGLSGVGEVYTKTYGTAPHRQFWITWFAATNPSDTSSINFWSIALEETTNNIYIVDESGAYYWNNVSKYTAPNLTLGIQVSNSLAYEIAGSPNINSLTNQNTNGSNSYNDYYEFCPNPDPAYAAQVVSSNIVNGNAVYGVGIPYPVNANIANIGTTALSGLTLNWSVDGLPANSNAASVSIAAPNPVVTGNAASTINWTPLTAGMHTMKIWVTKLNGSNANADLNDTLTINNISVIDSIQPKTVLFEEFMNASCNPCMYASPNLDGVLTSTQSICIPIRYHVSWPGRDYMNKATWIPYDSERTFGYYGVTGVPDARIDGSTDVSPSTVTTSDVTSENVLGSPFKITITKSRFNAAKDSFEVTAEIKSYGTFSAGLAAQAVLTVDTIKYKQDQSQEDPPSSFPNTNPQSYFQYVVNFPEVVEEMMTGTTGQSLAAFAPYQVQTINISWKKTHPWGTQRATWQYDSLFPGEHITVFVQDNNSHYVYQAATAPVVGGGATGVQEISNGVSFNMYPNPTNGNTTLAFNLEQDQNVTVQVYNMLGEVVYSTNEGTLSTGQHTIMINGSTLNNAVYLVKLTTDSGVTVQRLIIQH